MDDGRAWLICAFLMCCWCSVSVRSQAPTCTVNFELDDETNDQRYLEFMADLEQLSFSLADECPNPAVINNLVWQYRLTAYQNYEEEMQNCRCSRTQEAFEICVEVVWGMIKSEVVMKRAEYYGFCGEDYESLSLDRFDLYELYKDEIVECRCKETDTEFLECMGNIRNQMKGNVREKRTEIEEEYCKFGRVLNPLDSRIFS